MYEMMCINFGLPFNTESRDSPYCLMRESQYSLHLLQQRVIVDSGESLKIVLKEPPCLKREIELKKSTMQVEHHSRGNLKSVKNIDCLRLIFWQGGVDSSTNNSRKIGRNLKSHLDISIGTRESHLRKTWEYKISLDCPFNLFF